jgi:hypothetical protein
MCSRSRSFNLTTPFFRVQECEDARGARGFLANTTRLSNNAQASLPLWAIPLTGLKPRRFVFTTSWTALDAWTILCHIISKKIERSPWLFGRFFVLNEFSLIAVDVRLEQTFCRQFMYPGFRAPELLGCSLGIQNLYG